MPPEIRQLSNITANEGDDEVLNCTASGFPLPTVVWFKDNEEYPGQLVGSYMQCVKDRWTCLDVNVLVESRERIILISPVWPYVARSLSMLSACTIIIYNIDRTLREL